MWKNIQNVITIIIVGLVIYIGFLFYQGKPSTRANTLGTNVTTTEGKQIIEVTAKGGYSPAKINAKADTLSVLRIKTNNTFDCSSSLVISKLGVRKNLPPTGVTDIEIAPQKAGTTIAAACSMGMYNFNIIFN